MEKVEKPWRKRTFRWSDVKEDREGDFFFLGTLALYGVLILGPVLWATGVPSFRLPSLQAASFNVPEWSIAERLANMANRLSGLRAIFADSPPCREVLVLMEDGTKQRTLMCPQSTDQ